MFNIEIYVFNLFFTQYLGGEADSEDRGPGPWVGLKVQRPDMHHYVLR